MTPSGSEQLRPKTARLLEVLLESRDRSVSSQELLETVWENTAVTSNVLYQGIKEIRVALGGREESNNYLVSLRSRGYQWVFSGTRCGDQEETSVVEEPLNVVIPEPEQQEPEPVPRCRCSICRSRPGRCPR